MQSFTVYVHHVMRVEVPYGLAQPALSVSCKAPFGLGRYAAPASHAT